MYKNVLKRIFLICIILLIIQATAIPSINGNIGKIRNFSKNEFIENLNLQYTFSGDPPDEEWNKTYGGSEYDYDIGFCVQQTKDNGYIIAGTSAPPEDKHYSLLVKTDAYGIELWNKSNGDLPGYSGTSVHQTNEGGYILTGNIYQNESIFADILLCKTDLNGTEEWTKIIDFSDEDTSNCVRQTSDGGFIITGSSILFDGYQPIDAYGWLIKTDSNGNIQWNKTCPSLSFSNSVKETTDGGYILTGGFLDSFSSQDCDILLIKTDNSGTIIWEKTFGETEYDYGLSVCQTSDHGYIITGPSDNISSGDSQIFLIKTDTNGNETWKQEFGGDKYDIGYSVDQTNDGGYIIAGRTNSYGFGSDAWMIKTDEQGKEMWSKTFGPYGSSYSVEQTKEGGYIMVGDTSYYGYPKSNVWLIKVAPDYEYQPDLECSGIFNWSGIKPGSTFNDSFNVENIGGNSSLLDWKIESFPEWGTWTFTPSSQNDLKVEDGPITVQITIKAPNEKEKTFSGDIKLVSKHDSSDNCTISVSLTTPRFKAVSFNSFLLRLLNLFPTLFSIIKTLQW